MPGPSNPQNLNRYSYVSNNPCRYNDPSGRCKGTAQQHDPEEDECWRAYQQAIGYLGSDYVYLQFWSLAMLNSLLSWLEAGIGFAGRWESDALYFVVTMLDAYAGAYGRDRFLTAIRHGVMAQTNGRMGNLVFERIREKGPVPAGWADREGRIKVWDSFFDPEVMKKEGCYDWGFAKPSQWVSSHEIGHVFLDGLKAEDPRANSFVDDEYARAVGGLAPHPDAPPFESLSTEIGLYALGVDRPQEVRQYWTNFMLPLLYGQKMGGR